MRPKLVINKMKDSGIKWLGEIPEHWEVIPIKRITSIPITDGPHETPEFLDDGIPFISAEAIKNDKIDFSKKRGFISVVDHTRFSKKYKPQKGDIYVVKSGATTGNVAYVDTDDEEFNIWSPLAVIRPHKMKAITHYVFFLMKSLYFFQSIEISWSYGTQQNIGMNVIENLSIALPPLSEQRTIAAFLVRETERIDQLIARKERQIELLQEKRTALISHVVTKGLNPKAEMKDSGIEWVGDIPEHWDAVPVKRQYEIQLGKMLQNNPSSESDISVSYIKALHVLWGEVDTSDLPDMWASPADLKQFRVKSGDLLVCEGGEAGRAGIVDSAPVTCIIQNALHRVREKGADVRYLQYVLQTVSSEGWFDVLCNKATIAHFTREKLANLRMPLPPSLEEQRALSSFLDRETARIDALVEKVRKSIELLREYRTALISAAVTGKIDVRKEAA